MSSQERIMLIFIRLLQGEKLSKYELMDEFQKNASTIQRDIMIIEDILLQFTTHLPKNKFSPFKEIGSLDRLEKGIYQLSDFNKSTYFSDLELYIIFKILFASRGLHETELKLTYDKLFANFSDKKSMNNLLANERFYYEGVPKENVTPSIDIILKALLNKQLIEFTYTKNGETKTFQRVPMDIYFSDLYFFMISAKHTAKDDTDFSSLNKFRINNMKDIRVLTKQQQIEYANRFEGGILRNQTALPFFGDPITLVIDFFYDPVYVLDRFPKSKIKQINPDGSHRIEIPANNGYGVKMWLLEQGAHVKVISPKYMGDYLIENISQTLSYYGYSVENKKNKPTH